LLHDLAAEANGGMKMYRVVLVCHSVPAAEGAQVAADIQQEFADSHSPRCSNVSCVFEHGNLVLSANNDGWDRKGLNLMDEFSDCLSAYVCSPFDGDLKPVSVTAC
jgi:hypothetical protein